MLNDIKFTSEKGVQDRNGNSIDIGDVVIFKSKYGTLSTAKVCGITLNEKYVWLIDEMYTFKRMPNNIILVSDYKNWK